jgi:hypothetical protein
MPIGLRGIGQLVRVRIHAAGGHLVQQRLPDVRGAAIDQYDARRPPVARGQAIA